MSIQTNMFPFTQDEFDKLFQGGAILYEDGIWLYNAIRQLRPARLLEFGGFIGVSTRILVEAIMKNDYGYLFAVDIQSPVSEYMLQRHGAQRASRLTDANRRHVTLITADAREIAKALPDESFDFIFEDTDHTVETTTLIATEVQRILIPGGVAAFHDSMMKPVVEGFTNAGIIREMEFIPNTGIAIWRKLI